MKIRTDFVTNSSSSSFILAFSDKNNIDCEVREKFKLYHPMIQDIISRDAQRSNVLTKAEIMDAANCMPTFDEYGMVSFDVENRFLAHILAELWYVAEWEVQSDLYDNRNMSWSEKMDYMDSDDGRKEICDLFKENFSYFADYDDDTIFVEVEYEDHGEPGNMLEHEVLPTRCVVRFNHH